MRPLFSCVIPAYNGAAFLPEAVESALHQDFPESEREIIVVDDASTDGTPGVLRRYAGKIRVLRHAVNRGQGEALRTAVRAAHGRIIAELDQDDVWRPRKLACVERAFQAFKGVVAVCHTVSDVDRDRRPVRSPSGAPPIQEDRLIDPRDESVLFYSPRKEIARIDVGAGGSSWSVLRSSVLPRLAVTRPPRLWADLFYVFAAMASGGKAVRLKAPLSLWRWHEKSASFSAAGDMKKSLGLLSLYGDSLARARGLIADSRCPRLARDLDALLEDVTARSLLWEHRASARARPGRRPRC
jgi:glycosyltransferase involved in cell wall biosynthesis